MVTLALQRGLVWIALGTAVVAVGVPARAAPDESAETFYKYVDENGRTVYTNSKEQVPVEQRHDGLMDLSKISLNTELARELDQRFEAEHEELTETPYCEKARDEAQVGLFQQLWDEYGPLLACGGLLLLLGLFTPIALKRYGAPAWAKVLTFVIPALAVVGLVGFSMSQAHKKVSALKQRAAPCEKDTFSKLSEAADPLSAHQQLVERLRQEVESARGVVTR